MRASYDMLVSDMGLGLGIHEVKLLISDGSRFDSDITTINIIPEPATILLFTLGAVFLRRRCCSCSEG